MTLESFVVHCFPWRPDIAMPIALPAAASVTMGEPRRPLA